MATNKKHTGKVSRRKADARVLGQILAAQNIEFVLPDIPHIAEFYAETLMAIPGIAACRICLEDVTIQRGEMQGGGNDLVWPYRNIPEFPVDIVGQVSFLFIPEGLRKGILY